MGEYKVEVEKVCKEFKKELVLENVTLKFESGKIYGIVGRNGSGKSVLLKMIAGLMIPTEGEVKIDGEILKKGNYAKDTGVLLDCTGFLPEYSARENLYAIAKIRGIIGEKEIAEILERVGLDAYSNKTYRKFSLGMKQKLAIAQAFMEKPSLLLLDEPMNSLDEESVEDMREMFLEYVRQNHATILLTSHHGEDIQRLCDVVYEIRRHKIICSSEK